MAHGIRHLIAVAALACAPPARAAPDPLAEARVLYEEGAALFRQGRFREAAERFEAAYALDPSPILLYNLARSAEELGDARGAAEHYQAYLAHHPQADDRAEVERRIRVLEAVSRHRPGRLVLLGAPAGAQVTLDGEPAPEPGPDGGWALTPGRHALRVEAGGGAPWAQDLEIRTDETLEVVYAADDADRPWRTWGWVAAGAGVALAGGAVWFGLRSNAAEDDFHRLERAIAAGGGDREALAREKAAAQDDARGNARVANLLWGVAGAAAATGVTLLVLDLGDDGAASTALTPFPGGLGLTGSF